MPVGLCDSVFSTLDSSYRSLAQRAHLRLRQKGESAAVSTVGSTMPSPTRTACDAAISAGAPEA
jgi:hypothetical protein